MFENHGKSFLFLALCATLLNAKEDIANQTYLQTHGLTGDKVTVKTSSLKKEIHDAENTIQDEYKNDYSEAIILQNINKHSSKGNVLNVEWNFLALPTTYQKEKRLFEKELARIDNSGDFSNEETIERLLLLHCATFSDYKIMNQVNMKMICRDKKDVSYKLFARVVISTNEIKMESKPYLLEDEYGHRWFLKESKSKLYNTLSGSDNLATYVDRRVFENINKAMATTIGTSVPKMSKDFLDQKNKANTTVTNVDNGNSVTTSQSTTNPQPKVEDYGIKLLVDTIGSGIKAATDQLYKDLGYIYFIPKDSLFNAEIFITEKKYD